MLFHVRQRLKGCMEGDLLLIRGRVAGRFAHLERGSTTAIKEALGNSTATTHVGRSVTTIEVWSEIDLGTIVHARCEDTWNHDTDIGSGVC